MQTKEVEGSLTPVEFTFVPSRSLERFLLSWTLSPTCRPVRFNSAADAITRPLSSGSVPP
eukprot:764300-Hanusia_phi.AAC.8